MAYQGRIYISGPLTVGDPVHNVNRAIRAADEALAMGYAPFLPHLNWLWHEVSPKPYEDWLALDKEWLRQCDVVYRLKGESPGAEEECKLARELKLPVILEDTP
jgi:hypothetical protein